MGSGLHADIHNIMYCMCIFAVHAAHPNVCTYILHIIMYNIRVIICIHMFLEILYIQW